MSELARGARLVRIATRKSPLALWQAGHIGAALTARHPDITTEALGLTTRGDLGQPAAGAFDGKALFVREVDQAVLDGRADIAVHSMKDVPAQITPGLVIAAVPARGDPHDALVCAPASHLADNSIGNPRGNPAGGGPDPAGSNHDKNPANNPPGNSVSSFAQLPQAARVGTASLRRRCQLLHHRPDLRVGALRGNVGTRLAKLDAGEFDAIVLACAGLARLGHAARIGERLPPALCLPAIGQGALCVLCRADDAATQALLAPLDDAATRACVAAERACALHLGADCRSPVAAHAAAQDGGLHLSARAMSQDGQRMLHAQAQGDDPAALGREVATQLLAQGARELLDAS